MNQRRLHLGLNALNTGSYRAGWRRPGIDPASTATGEFYIRVAQEAERGLLDILFLADQPTLQPGWERSSFSARLDPVIALTAAVQHTEHLGVVTTVATTWNHPYNVARTIQSLDRVSHGRAGWNVVTSYNPRIALNYGLDELPPKPERYQRAEEFLQVVTALWRTWSPDAIVADKNAGVFAVGDKVRPISHTGKYFKVNGGSSVPPSEQGLPVIFQAGASGEGLNLAARYADASFVSASTLEVAVDYRRRLDAASVIRDPARPRVLAFPAVTLTLGSTDEEALRRKDELDAADGRLGDKTYIASQLGLSADELDIDAPLAVEKIDAVAKRREFSDGFLNSLRAQAKTGRPLRELLREGTGHYALLGSPRTVADRLEEWFATGAIDGFVLTFDVIEEGLPAFVDEVVPILRERGLRPSQYEGKTLRELLDLPIPAW